MTDKQDKQELGRARRLISEASSVMVLTGAGISAESGIPTFRGEGGLWEGFAAEELATPEAFANDPALVWRWYLWRRGICLKAEPNLGHRALVRLEEATEDFLLVSQNVDGLHRRAGSRALIELHGNIDLARCTKTERIFDLGQALLKNDLPHDPLSGHLARPHILWFGETYWPGILEQAGTFADKADVCLVVGTSAQVWPPVQLALQAQDRGATLIDINPHASELSRRADLWLQGSAGELLPAVVGDLG